MEIKVNGPAGAGTSAPESFLIDGVVTTVSQDTITPANSKPLPVRVFDSTGAPIDAATASKQDAQSVLLGAVTETAPANDIASSGLNGRLQRIAQRLTSLIALFPSSIGTKNSAGSLSVVLASDQAAQTVNQGNAGASAWLVDGSAVTQPVSGTVTANAGSGTFAVSAVALPLPAGASTSALQTTGNTSLGSIDTKTPALVFGRVPVDGSGVTQPVSGVFFQATQPISAAALPLPAGAATSAKQPALGVAGTPSADVITVQGVASMTALKVDGSAVTQPVSGSLGLSGKSKVNLARNDYSSTSVTTGAYVQLIASTASAASLVELFDSSGQTLVLAVGAAASEVDQFYINPGGNGQVPLAIPSGSRVSIKAVTATASAGYINLTLYS